MNNMNTSIVVMNALDTGVPPINPYVLDCGCLNFLFLEVDLQRSTYIVFAFVVLHSRGGPGSWLMHFPYVVLHGCFGFF